MIDKEQLFIEICAVLVDIFGLDKEEITMELDLAADIGMDSLDFVDIIMALEDIFDIDIDESTIEKYGWRGETGTYNFTVQNLIDAVIESTE